MDIATAEFFRKEREQCTTRDAKHVMPIKLIPDLEWEFIENIGVMKSDKGVQIYCIKEAEDEHEDTQVTEVSEPKSDVKANENIEPVVTEAVEAPRATQTTKNSNVTESEETRYEHRETSKIVTEDAVPREKSEIAKDAVPRENSETSEDADPRYEHREKTDTVTKMLYLGKPRKKLSPQRIVEVEVTHTIDITELFTGIPEPTLEAASKGNEESMTTPPGSPQRENPEIQNYSEDTTGIDAVQVNKKTHKYPEANNSLINKIFSVFRQAKEFPIAPMETMPL